MNEDIIQSELLRRIVDFAIAQGAKGAEVIDAKAIRIEDDFAKMCKEPHRCPNFGCSANCPPFVPGPEGFRDWIKKYRCALVFFIEVPTEDLLAGREKVGMGWLQETAARIEHFAAEKGIPDPKGFGGGNCKNLFCDSHPDCRVLKKRGPCRNPESARPSMSGFGIDVAWIMKLAGKDSGRVVGVPDTERPSTGYITGLVLLD